MRAVVQRVTSASVSIDGLVIGQIGAGLLALVGVTHTDTAAHAVKLARKIAGLRILRDGDRDEAAADSSAAPVLVVSQFTLYGDTARGKRPSWQAAAPGSVAEPMLAVLVAELRQLGLPVETGRFGAMMAVASVNDGPFTLLLEV
ncbi:MAG: D-aminoacyl-tRNA deacylase [Jatrophihabitantaceae bacterium]